VYPFFLGPIKEQKRNCWFLADEGANQKIFLFEPNQEQIDSFLDQSKNKKEIVGFWANEGANQKIFLFLTQSRTNLILFRTNQRTKR
jgi:hypothetical protein